MTNSLIDLPYLVFSKTLFALLNSFRSSISRKLMRQIELFSSSERLIDERKREKYFSRLVRNFYVILFDFRGSGGMSTCGNCAFRILRNV